MTRTFIQNPTTKVGGRASNIASSTNATPTVVTFTVPATVAISGASNTPNIQITTSAVHGLKTGDKVTVASVGGNTAANTSAIVDVIDTLNFRMRSVDGNGAYTSGGTVQLWQFQNGDIVTIASHTTNTGANGTWVVSAASATTITPLNPNSNANSVGNGVGGATGTITHSGRSYSPSLDISAIDATVFNLSLRIRVSSLTVGKNAVFQVRDSVDAFANHLPGPSVVVPGGISPQAPFEVVFNFREIPRIRFNTASAVLQVYSAVDSGGTVAYDAFLEY